MILNDPSGTAKNPSTTTAPSGSVSQGESDSNTSGNNIQTTKQTTPANSQNTPAQTTMQTTAPSPGSTTKRTKPSLHLVSVMETSVQAMIVLAIVIGEVVNKSGIKQLTIIQS